MRAEALIPGEVRVINVEKTRPKKRDRLSEKLNRLFQHCFQSDWERTAEQSWKEWVRLEDRVPMAIHFMRKKWT